MKRSKYKIFDYIAGYLDFEPKILPILGSLSKEVDASDKKQTQAFDKAVEGIDDALAQVSLMRAAPSLQKKKKSLLDDKSEIEKGIKKAKEGFSKVKGLSNTNRQKVLILIQKHLDAIDKHLKTAIDEEAPAPATNNAGSGEIAGLDGKGVHPKKKKSKMFRRKDEEELEEGCEDGVEEEYLEPSGKFAGVDVFDVDHETFHKCQNGKHPHHRYNKYVNEDDDLGKSIKNYGKRYPQRPLILRNSLGTMSYFVPPKRR